MSLQRAAMMAFLATTIAASSVSAQTTEKPNEKLREDFPVQPVGGTLGVPFSESGAQLIGGPGDLSASEQSRVRGLVAGLSVRYAVRGKGGSLYLGAESTQMWMPPRDFDIDDTATNPHPRVGFESVFLRWVWGDLGAKVVNAKTTTECDKRLKKLIQNGGAISPSSVCGPKEWDQVRREQLASHVGIGFRAGTPTEAEKREVSAPNSIDSDGSLFAAEFFYRGFSTQGSFFASAALSRLDGWGKFDETTLAPRSASEIRFTAGGYWSLNEAARVGLLAQFVAQKWRRQGVDERSLAWSASAFVTYRLGSTFSLLLQVGAVAPMARKGGDDLKVIAVMGPQLEF